MTPREQRARLARETLAIVSAGHYVDDAGNDVRIAEAVRACIETTRLFMPQHIAAQELPEADPSRPATAFAVRDENTLSALARLVAAGCRRVGVLNFASARHPGGGFERGAQAQEEALARSSALHASLVSEAAAPFYRTAPDEASCLYTDRVILSPDCPVFRDADGRLLRSPVPATFLTCAAPNASALQANESERLPLLPETFARRAGGVLAVAAHADCDALVLGAWGCGVFGNDPALVASVFARLLCAGGAFENRFAHVDFAVLDSAPDRARLRAFERAFPQGAS
jgi:uncharacterized protein (TIGR02452 family)